MYAFNYHEGEDDGSPRRGTPASRPKNEEAVLLAGGQSLMPAMKLRLRMRLDSPAALVDLGALAGAERHQGEGGTLHHRRDHAARGGRRVRGRGHRRYRRSPASPTASATGRCATWARSAARSPTTTRRRTTRRRWSACATVNTNKRAIAADNFFTGDVRNGAPGRRDHHRGRASRAQARALREVQGTRRRVSRSWACSSPRPGVVRVAVTGAGRACSARTDWRRRSSKFAADSVANVKQSDNGLNTDIHASPSTARTSSR